jgi:hypothetical protein
MSAHPATRNTSRTPAVSLAIPFIEHLLWKKAQAFIPAHLSWKKDSFSGGLVKVRPEPTFVAETDVEPVCDAAAGTDSPSGRSSVFESVLV